MENYFCVTHETSKESKECCVHNIYLQYYTYLAMRLRKHAT